MAVDRATTGATMRAKRAIHRSNIGIGIITLLVIALASAAGIFLPGLLRQPLLQYQIAVPAGEDISGIGPGTEVTIAGLVRGHVLAVTDSQQPGRPATFVIQFEIAPDPPIYSDARARFLRDVVSNRARIDFVRAGVPDESSKPLAPGNDVQRNTEDGDASMFLTPSAQRSYERAWAAVERAKSSWGPMIDDAKSRSETLTTEFTSLRSTIGDDVARYEERITHLVDRYGDLKARFTRLQEEWIPLREEMEATRAMLADDGPTGRVRRLMAAVSERWGVMGSEGQGLGSLFTGISRRWDDLTRSGMRLRDQLAGFPGELELRAAFADLTIASEQFARLTNGGLGTILAAIVPAHNPRDERADAMDELSRMLLIGMEQAKAAESSLRALLEGGEDFPRMTVDLERLGETLQRLSDIEQALWHLRVEPSTR